MYFVFFMWFYISHNINTTDVKLTAMYNNVPWEALKVPCLSPNRSGVCCWYERDRYNTIQAV